MKGWLAAQGLDPRQAGTGASRAAGVGHELLGLAIFVLCGAREWHATETSRVSALSLQPDGHASTEHAVYALLATLGTLGLMGLDHAVRPPRLRAAPLGLCARSGRRRALVRSFAGRGAAPLRCHGRSCSIGAILFWAIFEQAGLTIALFAEQSDAQRKWPAGPFRRRGSSRSIRCSSSCCRRSSLSLWMRLGDRQPSSPVKFGLALVFLAASFLLMVPAALLTVEGEISPLWLVGLFFLQTTGELLLSPVGLSTMTRLAPRARSASCSASGFLASRSAASSPACWAADLRPPIRRRWHRPSPGRRASPRWRRWPSSC